HCDHTRECRSDREESSQRCNISRRSGIARTTTDGHRSAAGLRPRHTREGAHARRRGGARTGDVHRRESGRAAEGERKSEMKKLLLLFLLTACSFFSRTQNKIYTLDRIDGAAAPSPAQRITT